MSLGGLGQLQADTRSDAFLAPDNPALLYRDVVRDQFGQSDPMLIAIVSRGVEGIYTPENLVFTQYIKSPFHIKRNLPICSGERTDATPQGD